MGWLALGGVPGAGAVSGDRAVDLAACDEQRTPWAQALEDGAPASAATTAALAPAQALWLDAQRLQWPGQPADGRYRLVRGAAPVVGDTLAEGRAMSGLLHPAAPLAPETAARWRHVAPGALLIWPDAPTTPQDWRGWLQDGAQRVHLVRLDAQERVLAATRLQQAGLLDALFARAAEPLNFGVQVGAAASAGRLWAPTARKVEVCLYPGATAAPAQRFAAEWEPASGSWRWQQPGDLRGRLYSYLVELQVPGLGWVRQRVSDPYAVSLSANSQRAALLDLDDAALKPEGWDRQPRPRPGLRLHEMVVYELHVRDFSLQDPGVRPAWRGRYPAFTEARSAGMAHLRSLARAGVTDLHLLPIFDLASVPEQGCIEPQVPKAAPDSEAQQAAVMRQAGQDCFNWGYDPLHFNAPEGSFATDAMDPAVRVRELRQMVLALQRAGLRVGMDVVYNHTSAAGQHSQSVLDRIVPGYYQRLNADGAVERSTCCDNTATEHAMMAKLMSDSVLLWARHYAMDSFRFDLMGHQPRAAMLAMQQRLKRELGRDILFIGEGWNFGEVMDGARFRQAIQTELSGDGIGSFSDRARDALRGGSFGSVAELQAAKGWSNGLLESGTRAQQLQAADLARLGLAGNLREYRFENADGQLRSGAEMPYAGRPLAGYAGQPGEAVAYVENHDNHTLFDANVLKMPPAASALERVQAQTVASAAVLFSQGVAYVHAGQELLRSKSLDRNSYDSGDWFNRLDFTLRDNGFAAGLPPAGDNGRDFEALKPLLRLAHAKPTPAQIRQARQAFLDLLTIRAGSSLWRLPSSAEVQRRLRFHNTGPDQDPALLIAELDGAGWPGAGARRLLLALNGAATPRSLALPALTGAAWRLHPLLSRAGAGDPRLRRQARLTRDGRLALPARSAAVFVLD